MDSEHGHDELGCIMGLGLGWRSQLSTCAELVHRTIL